MNAARAPDRPATRWLNALCVVSVGVATLWALDPPTAWLRDGVVYVSPDGSDWGLGSSRDKPVRTLQRAADLVSAGEHVVILPGVYRGNLRVRRGGSEGRPVVFRAEQPGTVTISEVAPASVIQELSWRDEGGGVHSAVTPWPVYYLRQGEAAAYHVVWGGLERLRALTSKPKAWPAFFHDAQQERLFLFLPGGLQPADARLTVHRRIPPPREWGNVRVVNVWVESSHVAFEGLRFDLGVGAGLLLWRAGDVAVRDCVFEGARAGITSLPQVHPADGLVIERSLYHHYPQYRWRQQWLDWREVYAHYPDSSLVMFRDAGLTVRNSLVVHAGDGLQVSPPETRDRFGAVIEHNVLVHGTDDVFELDGPASDVTIRGNLVHEFHQNLGLSPVLAGPVTIEGNRFLHPAGGVNGSQVKLLNPWYDAKRADNAPIRNVRIEGNIFVGNWLAWWHEAPVRDVHVVGNTFAVQRMKDPPWPAGVAASDNTVIRLPEAGYADPARDPRWWQGAAGPGVAQRRPGPAWLDWDKHPATADLAGRLPLAGWAPTPVSR